MALGDERVARRHHEHELPDAAGGERLEVQQLEKDERLNRTRILGPGALAWSLLTTADGG